MKRNAIDVVIGPIETYDDGLFGTKTAHEAYVLVKDREWSERLARYASFLPALQRGLPVADAYKREKPGTDSDLNAYDVVYYTGQSNAGFKTIAINLPNDEEVQLRRAPAGSVKNAMRASSTRFSSHRARADRAGAAAEHRVRRLLRQRHVPRGGPRPASRTPSTARERCGARSRAGRGAGGGKADVLPHMITRLHQQGELPTPRWRTIMSPSSPASSAPSGSAPRARTGGPTPRSSPSLQERGAFTRDSASGRYRVDHPKMRAAVDATAEQILRFQGDGDYAGVTSFMTERGAISPALQQDLDRLSKLGIPVDVTFEQGHPGAQAGELRVPREPKVVDVEPSLARAGAAAVLLLHSWRPQRRPSWRTTQLPHGPRASAEATGVRSSVIRRETRSRWRWTGI
jgi:hypothetical protein